MKKIFFALLVLTLSFAMVASVSAFSITDVSFGSNTQQRDQTTSTTIHLANDQNQSLTITLSAVAVSSDYRLTFSQATVTLAAGATADVPMTIYVPKYQNAGKTNIGTITASTNVAGVTSSANIYVTAENNLDVSKIYLETVDNSKSIGTGGTFKAKPGDDVTVTITVRNDYSSNVRMQDITADVYNGDLDIDESLDFSDLRYGDKDTASFSFTVPSDIDADTYHVDLTVRGRDENGATHGGDFSFDIDVQRESHELTVQSATLTPSTITCSKSASLSLAVKNTGSHNEDKMRVNIESDALNINQDFAGISLDTDSVWRKIYTFQVPSTVQPGQYNIVVTTYYDSNTDSGMQAVPITVAACSDNSGVNTQCSNYNQQFCVSDSSYQRCSATGTLSAVSYCQQGFKCQSGQCAQVTAPINFPPDTSAPSYGTKSFLDSPAFVVLLIVAAVILLAFIIVLLVKFVF